jgi:3-hydroxyisobutyrate dehydrogenase-like beta-hydroxyacid dehydrogenase
MAKVAVCGMGFMGRPMAERLLRRGHAVTVWNRTRSKAEPLARAGAAVAATPADAMAGADVVITMLSTSGAVRAVVTRPGGLAEGLAASPGTVMAEMSTVGPAFVHELTTLLPDGAEMVDAPVLGSTPQAERGELQVFVGGSSEVYERLEPLLRDFGRPRHIGPLGSGQAMKLMVNSTLPSLMATLGEALALADVLGLDQAAVLDVLEDSAIGPSTRSKRSRIERDVYEPNFKLELALKDALLVDEAARAAGLELDVGAAARRWFEAAEAAGLGTLDYSAVVAHIRGRPASQHE